MTSPALSPKTLPIGFFARRLGGLSPYAHAGLRIATGVPAWNLNEPSMGTAKPACSAAFCLVRHIGEERPTVPSPATTISVSSSSKSCRHFGPSIMRSLPGLNRRLGAKPEPACNAPQYTSHPYLQHLRVSTGRTTPSQASDCPWTGHNSTAVNLQRQFRQISAASIIIPSRHPPIAYDKPYRMVPVV